MIILTGRSPVQRELDALQGGAIDFVDKARGVDVLVPRMRLLVRTDIVQPEPGPVISGPLLLQPYKGRAEWRGRDIGLTVVEQKIVALLVANAGQPVTYRAIYDQVHYAGFVAGDGERGCGAERAHHDQAHAPQVRGDRSRLPGHQEHRRVGIFMGRITMIAI